MPTPTEELSQRRQQLQQRAEGLQRRAQQLQKRRQQLARERRQLAREERQQPVPDADRSYFAGSPWRRWVRRLDSVTQALIAINVAVFLLDWLLGGRLFLWGAKYGPLITIGHQYWRLLTAVFLHGGIIHLLVNTYALYYLGPPLEQALGMGKFLVVYVLGGITGNALSTLLLPTVTSIGSSSAIFGLLGYFLFLRVATPRLLTPSGARSIAFLIGINLLLGFLPGSHVDNGAHLGGLLGGLLAGLLVGPPAYGRDVGHRWPLVWRLAAAAALIGIWMLSIQPRSAWARPLAPGRGLHMKAGADWTRTRMSCDRQPRVDGSPAMAVRLSIRPGAADAQWVECAGAPPTPSGSITDMDTQEVPASW